MARFDEIELHGHAAEPHEPPPAASRPTQAPLMRRVIAFVIDFSLFIAAAIAMSPIIPEGEDANMARLAVVGFLAIVSLYYLSLGWMVWGKTIGAAIMDIRVVSQSLGDVDIRRAASRWAGTVLSILTLGLGFIPALFGERKSLADRISGTRVVTQVET